MKTLLIILTMMVGCTDRVHVKSETEPHIEDATEYTGQVCLNGVVYYVRPHQLAPKWIILKGVSGNQVARLERCG